MTPAAVALGPLADYADALRRFRRGWGGYDAVIRTADLARALHGDEVVEEVRRLSQRESDVDAIRQIGRRVLLARRYR